MKTAFYICGAIAELVGILLVASPDLVPGAAWAGGWLRRRWRSIENRVRGWFGREPRSIATNVSVSGNVGFSGSLTTIKSTSATTLEEKVDFLQRRDQEAQRLANELAARIGNLEAALATNLANLREELHGRLEQRVADAQADYRAARVAGVLFLTLGLGLTTVANFVHSPKAAASRSVVASHPAQSRVVTILQPGESGDQIAREWAIAVGTIGAAFAALYVGVWRDRWRRPDLKLGFVPLSSDPQSTDQLVVDDPMKRNTAAYVRLRVVARERRNAAERVEVMVTGARALAARAGDPPMSEPRAIAIDGMPLRWSYSTDTMSDPVTPITIPSGSYRHIDLIRVKSLIEFQIRPPLAAIVEVRPFPGGERSMVTAAEFEVDLSVTASNAPPKRYSSRVRFDGEWDVQNRADIWNHLTVSQPRQIS